MYYILEEYKKRPIFPEEKNEELCEACVQGNLEVVKKLLST